MGSALLTRSGSTALSLPSARLRNLFRSELRSDGTSNSARRRLRDRSCSASAVPSLRASRDAGPTSPNEMVENVGDARSEPWHIFLMEFDYARAKK